MCCGVENILEKQFRILYYSLLCKVSLWVNHKVYIAHGAMVFFWKNRVYKIQIDGKSVLEDVENRKKIFYNKYPSNKIYIINKSPLIIVSNQLEKGNLKNENVIKLLEAISVYGEKKVVCYEECLGIKYGLDALHFYKTGNKKINEIVVILKVILKKPIRIGKVHGDVHEKNILKSSKEKYVLIDFDCAREDDIQAFDAMYYIFEKERNKTKKPWLVFWRLFLKNEKELIRKYKCFFVSLIDLTFKEVMVILFIERLGQEYNHSEEICRYNMMKVVEEILHLDIASNDL